MDRLWKVFRNRKLNNAGSALLTVILVVGFVSILATILLYVTGMNFQIKQADYQNTKNFYSGEMALEEIRAKLLADASQAAVEAYNEVLRHYAEYGAPDMRTQEYRALFVKRLTNVEVGKETNFTYEKNGIWHNKLGAAQDWNVFLAGYCTAGTNYVCEMDASYDTNGDGVWSPGEVLDINPSLGKVRIKGLRVRYTDDNGRTTIIYTDFDVFAPDIDWTVEGSRDTLETGVTVDQAASRNAVDISNCVRYTNWRKE